MLRFFRKRRPAHRAERLSVTDAITASAWGLSEDDWNALTDHERAEARRTITTAPRFVS